MIPKKIISTKAAIFEAVKRLLSDVPSFVDLQFAHVRIAKAQPVSSFAANSAVSLSLLSLLKMSENHTLNILRTL